VCDRQGRPARPLSRRRRGPRLRVRAEGRAPLMTSTRRGDLFLGAGVIGVLTVLVAPLPPMLLDFLLTTNLTLSLLILFVAMFVRRPLEFSVFPSLLLVATLYRLSLNVAATRLILLHGGEGSSAA